MLESAPYSLSLGEGVFVTVMATNVKGNSGVSAVGHGATIITNPDPPRNLAEDET